MVRLLSYIYPITKKVASEYNDILEITWYNGEKHLNSKNANYSYGSLQKILKIGLQKLDLKNYNEILVLGLGGGSVIETLREDFNYQKNITALEIDPVIIQIAEEEFNIRESENLKIICVDALTYMQQNKKQFDLIILDLYIDIHVPSSFLKISFWQTILKASKQSILFNASLEANTNDKISTIISLLKENKYHVEKLEKVNQTNTLVIANIKN
jgi:predicted membrane-bound spermidine synthase